MTEKKEYNPQGNVETMMDLFGQEVKPKPELPNKETLLLRAKLNFEETMELVKACGCNLFIMDKDGERYRLGSQNIFIDTDNFEPNLVEYADGCADILVVTYGALSAAGIKAPELFEEINRSNMSKVWEDGTIHKREDGKVIKPSTYSPADVKKVLENQSK